MHGGSAKQVRKKANERLEVAADRVLEELCHVSFVDIREAFDESGNLIEIKDLPDRVAKAISGIEFEDLFEGSGKYRVKVGRTAKIKMADKLGGLERIAKHLGLYAADKIQLNGANGGPVEVTSTITIVRGQRSDVD